MVLLSPSNCKGPAGTIGEFADSGSVGLVGGKDAIPLCVGEVKWARKGFSSAERVVRMLVERNPLPDTRESKNTYYARIMSENGSTKASKSTTAVT